LDLLMMQLVGFRSRSVLNRLDRITRKLESKPGKSCYCSAWSTRSSLWARDLVAHAMKSAV